MTNPLTPTGTSSTPVSTTTLPSTSLAIQVPSASFTTHRLLLGDSRRTLTGIASDSIDLIITSPPYAQARAHTYGGINPEDYVDWFLPIADQLQRVLKPTGTFLLNIKESCVRGERLTYVLELILALKQQGWLWTEEFIWHKKQCYPGKYPNRFRDAWERLLQFNLQRDFAMHQDAVRVPAKGSTTVRGNNLTATDYLQVVSGSGSGLRRSVASCTRVESKTGSRFGRTPAGFVGRTLVYPDNVLYLAVETKNRGHSAPFPESLPDWFIRLFTRPGDLVLDPFMGSGTTNTVAKRLGRNSIGIDAMPAYVARARRRVADVRVSQPAEVGATSLAPASEPAPAPEPASGTTTTEPTTSAPPP